MANTNKNEKVIEEMTKKLLTQNRKLSFLIRDYYKSQEPLFGLRSLKGYFNEGGLSPEGVEKCFKVFYIPKKSGGHRKIYAINEDEYMGRSLKRHVSLTKKVWEQMDENLDTVSQLLGLFKEENINVRPVISQQKKYERIFLNQDLRKRNSYGFEKGKSIVMNAQAHCNSSYFFKSDISKAFPTITKQEVNGTLTLELMRKFNFLDERTSALLEVLNSEFKFDILDDYYDKNTNYLNQTKYLYDIYLSRENILSDFICENDSLVTGVSIAPMILNSRLYFVDYKIRKALKAKKGQNFVFTRYADDICISSDKAIPHKVKDICEKALSDAGFSLNKKKTLFQTKKQKNQITGIIVSYNTGTGHVGIGQKKFNQLKKDLYKMSKGQLNPKEVEKTMGMLSFLESVDKERYDYVVNKYSIVR